MPTAPVEAILPYRNMEKAISDTLMSISNAVRESLHFGTHVLDWCITATESQGRGEDVIPSIMLLRQTLDHVDGISILLANGSVDPCKLLLRTVLESLMNAKYMLKDNTEEKGISFLVCQKKDAIAWGEKFLQTSSNANGAKSEEADLEKCIQETVALLQRPPYKKASDEYDRLQSKGERFPRWYSFFGGPKSISKLAKQVGLSDHYDELYNEYSSAVHARDILAGKIKIVGPGEMEVGQIRFGVDAPLVGRICIILCLAMYKSYIEHYDQTKTETFHKWIDREIKPFQLGKIRIILEEGKVE